MDAEIPAQLHPQISSLPVEITEFSIFIAYNQQTFLRNTDFDGAGGLLAALFDDCNLVALLDAPQHVFEGILSPYLDYIEPFLPST